MKLRFSWVVFVVGFAAAIGAIFTPVGARPGNDVLAAPQLQATITPTVTITPVYTVTVVVTSTPSPSPTITVIPLPPGAPAILGDIEAEFYTLWAQMGPLQLAYYFQYGRPWQGLMTHTTIPQDGTPTPPDRLLLHPTDVEQNWMDFMSAFNQPLPYAVRIDTYEGQGGRGFIGQLYVVVDGDTWHRAIDYGSGEFDQEWSIELLP